MGFPAFLERCGLHFAIVAVLGIVALAPGSASAATQTVRLAKQFGISYLPLTIIEKKGLLEQEGRKLGLDLRTEWVQFTGGTPMNEALISGTLDIVSGGVGPMLVIWAKTRGNLGVKGISALNSMPLVLDSYEVTGGPHCFNVIWTTTRYHDQNSLVIKAFLAARGEATQAIIADPAAAAAIFIADEHSKMAQYEVERIIKLPENEWTLTPRKVTAYAEFMARIGLVAARPASWKDLFFSDVHDLPGS